MKSPLPWDLPRLVMRRSSLVGVVAVALALLLGVTRTNDAVEEEVAAAATLADLVAHLAGLTKLDERAAIETLRRIESEGPLRHLQVDISTTNGRRIFSSGSDTPAALRRIAQWHREAFDPPKHQPVSWTIERELDGPWTVTLSASTEGELQEAVQDMAGSLLIMLGCIAGLLAVMRWNLLLAFKPLSTVLDAIQAIERQDLKPVQSLQNMPVRELECIAAALRHLAMALESAEAARRTLSQKVYTLQEEERAHLARELHDELGQRLTTLRFNTAWLSRTLSDRPEALAVVSSMSDRCAEIQLDVRHLLDRLRPLGDKSHDGGSAALTSGQLLDILGELVASWQRTQTGTQFAFDHGGIDPQARLPREVALAVYRLSQEALTNASKHAHATRVELRLSLDLQQREGGSSLHWAVEDNGGGIEQADAAQQRGNGLVGMQERVWSLAGRWLMSPGAEGKGLLLEAQLPLPNGQAPLTSGGC
ncbi:sensor histidine kinase [Ideonella sp.]|jgi:two-component system sensor histidine kinase UhpB|uniref:sensor histidine kinase n=1 Tax=Ideonella sp. TaxID=1929293 RepID=UPI0037C146D9